MDRKGKSKNLAQGQKHLWDQDVALLGQANFVGLCTVGTRGCCGPSEQGCDARDEEAPTDSRAQEVAHILVWERAVAAGGRCVSCRLFQKGSIDSLVFANEKGALGS